MDALQTQLLNRDKWIELYADYLFQYSIVRVNSEDIAKDLVQNFCNLEISA